MKSRLLHILQVCFITCLMCCVNGHSAAQGNTAESEISLNAQTANDSLFKVQVRKIIIEGNKKTKDYIILREMKVKPGDSIPVTGLLNVLEKDRRYIYNTTLFVEVITEPVTVDAATIDIKITVKERWYIFPVPELQFVDGTLNKWLVKYKGDLNRLNYGAKFTHYNLTGRKDKLRIHLLLGYTRTVSFHYRAPYSNPALTNGFSVGGGYFQNREIVYKTSYNNEVVFYKKDNIVSTSWNILLGYSIRKGIKLSHSFNLNYSHINIDDSIISPAYNPAYFNKPVSKFGYIDLNYTLGYSDVDNVLYPLTGFSGSVGLGKRGFGFTGGVNAFSIDGEFNKYWSLGKKWYVSSQVQGNIKLPFTQPYINQQGLGYGNNYVRGLEYKIIDGVAFAIAKLNLKKQLFHFHIKTFLKNSKTLNKLPFRIFAKTFADMGYSYNKQHFATRLNNTFLGSTGLGIDIVTFYDVQIRLEYSLNHLGQKGLFLHNEKGF